MNVYTVALGIGALVIPILLAMWFAWRARSRRDATAATQERALMGDVIAHFPRAGYVSTTPEGEPLVRVALPGLRYRGNAELTVRSDGVTIVVTGESPVHIGRSQLRGSTTARARVGKAVERDGLAVLQWKNSGRALESSFRFALPAEQHSFVAAIDTVAPGTATAETGATDTETCRTTQEDT